MILQTSLPYDVHALRPLPGIAPLDPADWLLVDEVHAAQMAERERLMTERREEVIALDPGAMPAALELLDTVLEHLPPGHVREGDAVRRPDGVSVRLDRDDPMATLGRLVQEDLCIMERHGEEHVLTGAVLCFPSAWRLHDKFMRPLVAIHAPVAPYDENIARRVQRLFDGIQPGRPLWRFNALWYHDPALFQASKAFKELHKEREAEAPFMRSERQCLLRLPKTRAVVFSIHIYVLARASVPELAALGQD